MKRIEALYQFERNQWAQLLHDDFGQSLAAIKSFAAGIKNNADITEEVIDLATIIDTTASDLYISCYDLMRGLRSGDSKNNNLISDIENCIINSRVEHHGIRLQLQAENISENNARIVNIFILRIFQDSLSGILRAACATEMQVCLKSVSWHKNNRITPGDNNTVAGKSQTSVMRESIELHMLSDIKMNSAFNPESEPFLQIQKYAEAFGGEYSVEKANDTSILIKLCVDITDFSGECR